MKATFDPDDGSADVVLCDYGQTESSGLDGSFEDLVEQMQQWQSDDAKMLHRGQRIVPLRFSSARKYASYAAAEAAILQLVRDFPRSTGTITFLTSVDGGATTLATITMTDAAVQLSSFRVVGITVILNWSVRGALVAP